ncbi:MAG: hypothetical protein K0U36_00050, partial [Alphaproteobacteria bacterium]|nr:hypothetical protein [Alphaproteobacteria bacterium]
MPPYSNPPSHAAFPINPPYTPSSKGGGHLRDGANIPVLQPVFNPPLANQAAPSQPFALVSNYSPAGDQPTAISELNEGIAQGMKDQVLL